LTNIKSVKLFTENNINPKGHFFCNKKASGN